MENLKLKVDQGIDFLITQLFFDNRDYFAFLEKARAAGIQCPVIPGILPVSDLAQIKRFVLKCGAKIPEAFLDRLEQTAGVSDQVQRIGVEHATLQCRELLESGVPGIHFYTLNRPTPTSLVLEALDWSSER
jgi:methylenetetrahydrofolate reductase (NADPH)